MADPYIRRKELPPSIRGNAGGRNLRRGGPRIAEHSSKKWAPVKGEFRERHGRSAWDPTPDEIEMAEAEREWGKKEEPNPLSPKWEPNADPLQDVKERALFERTIKDLIREKLRTPDLDEEKKRLLEHQLRNVHEKYKEHMLEGFQRQPEGVREPEIKVKPLDYAPDEKIPIHIEEKLRAHIDGVKTSLVVPKVYHGLADQLDGNLQPLEPERRPRTIVLKGWTGPPIPMGGKLAARIFQADRLRQDLSSRLEKPVPMPSPGPSNPKIRRFVTQ